MTQHSTFRPAGIRTLFIMNACEILVYENDNFRWMYDSHKSAMYESDRFKVLNEHLKVNDLLIPERCHCFK